ncbi:MAG TPA: hypothetical protein DCE80_08835 [Ignavibacteriales bacterium]|nr:hypothetical protein [Ignavibacteriales bacterium]
MDNYPDLADFLQRFTTKVLWHFTGYNKTALEAFGILKSIVSAQTLKISSDYQKIKMPSGAERLGYPASCVCDIPFKDLRIHTARYGNYGIAFKKDNAITRGHFNPVLYIQHDHHLFKHAEQLLDRFDNANTNTIENNKELREYLMIMGTYVKRSDLTRKISIADTDLDRQQKNNFYYEREWRSAYEWKFHVDDVAAILLPENHLGEMKEFIKNNSETQNYAKIPLISYEMVEYL